MMRFDAKPTPSLIVFISVKNDIRVSPLEGNPSLLSAFEIFFVINECAVSPELRMSFT